MQFQLLQVALWPRTGGAPRLVQFKRGVVNVISGASKTGKSAVIPIIDYCLGAEKCAIPVGVIRERCSWFGVIIDTVEGQKLLARREPGDQQSTGDMFMLEAQEVQVPDVITAKNTNLDAVKDMFNRLSGLTALDFDPSPDPGYRARPSFRDLMAFTFQPQNIVANPNVLFFKADTSEHREKLKVIFPYVLGAVTPQILQARAEIERLSRILRRKESELRTYTVSADGWRHEATTWLRQAIEMGLLDAETDLPTEWDDIVKMLREVAAANSSRGPLRIEAIDRTLERLQTLRDQESAVAAELSGHRQRLAELRRLLESGHAFGDAVRIQRDRLSISEWFRAMEDRQADALASLPAQAKIDLANMQSTLASLEIKLRSLPSMSDTLDKEILRQRNAAEGAMEQLNIIRREMADLEQTSEQARIALSRSDLSERFLGRVEQALQLYANADVGTEVRAEIEELKAQIADLQRIVREQEITRKMRNALDTIQGICSTLVPRMDAEWPDQPIRLVPEDLTLKVIRGTREDYLWEIGSGANWLAYHVAMTVALQRYFRSDTYHPVPALLIYDQPSQVYFPKILRGGSDADEDEPAWRDQDVAAVRKVFALLGDEVRQANGRLQVIVLDHADSEVWGGLAGVELTEEWRDDRALVPNTWAQ